MLKYPGYFCQSTLKKKKKTMHSILLSINPPCAYTGGAENCLDSSKLYLELFADPCSDKRS